MVEGGGAFTLRTRRARAFLPPKVTYAKRFYSKNYDYKINPKIVVTFTDRSR